jgi:hypothetical protein
MAQAGVSRPLREADLGHEHGLHPGRTALTDLVGERRRVPAQRLEPPGEVA